MLEICDAPVIWSGTVYGPPPTRSSVLGGDRINCPDAAPCATAAAGTEVVPGIAELPGGITATPGGAGGTAGVLRFVGAPGVPGAPGGMRPGVTPGAMAAPAGAGTPAAGAAGAPAGAASSAISGGGPVSPRF